MRFSLNKRPTQLADRFESLLAIFKVEGHESVRHSSVKGWSKLCLQTGGLSTSLSLLLSKLSGRCEIFGLKRERDWICSKSTGQVKI